MEQSKRLLRNDVAMAVTILALSLLLAVAGLILIDRWHSAAERLQAPMFDDLLGFIAIAAGLGIGAWWIATFLLAVAAALLRQSGKDRCAGAAAKLSPAFMRRLAVAILGLNLSGIPLASASPTEQLEPAWSPTHDSATSSSISAQWTPGRGLSRHPSAVPLSESGSSEIDPHWQPRPPVADPGLLGTRPQRAAEQHASPERGEVVVKRGDSLWSIAARQLGPMASDVDIALHWPKWYATNRNVIGDDPGLLIPGQILQPPPG
ncbi:LysM domain-containing protein [Arthrobacter sp. efr-133-R2A-63]|uniref:LysM peptidoglycan-binding domain-containing protein n=1 Tax=Arthrobacter sp. efr-133-R2A-63 TaxID=3040278 RepID=UPI00254A4BB6|nr:LysM domain-containing protein [Arthrobacter sp. efr-133-R2A-63]